MQNCGVTVVWYYLYSHVFKGLVGKGLSFEATGLSFEATGLSFEATGLSFEATGLSFELGYHLNWVII